MNETVFEWKDVRLHRVATPDGGENFALEVQEGGALMSKRALFDLGVAALDQVLEIRPDLPQCKGCKATIRWITTEGGRPTPVDPKPKTFVLNEGKYQVGFTPHWATCPNADEFRKKS